MTASGGRSPHFGVLRGVMVQRQVRQQQSSGVAFLLTDPRDKSAPVPPGRLSCSSFLDWE